MNTISKFLLTLLIVLQTSLLYAGDLKVMVSLFESKDSDKSLDRRMSIVCSEEVIRAKGFIYISPTEYVKAVTGDEKIAVDNVVDLEKEYSDSNMEYLQEMSKPNKNTFDRMFKALETADIIIGGTVWRDGPLIKAELTMANSRNQRQYTATVECAENCLDDKMRKAVREFLKKISRPVKIYADKLIDEKKSMVIYVLKTMDKTDVTIEMDYTGDRPDPQIQSVKILPPDGVNKNGVTTYRVKSDEGGIIEIEFIFKGGKTDSIRVDTPMPDPSIKAKQAETLTVKSGAGYVLKFEFVWDKGSMESARIYPALNPFGDNEE